MDSCARLPPQTRVCRDESDDHFWVLANDALKIGCARFRDFISFVFDAAVATHYFVAVDTVLCSGSALSSAISRLIFSLPPRDILQLQ